MTGLTLWANAGSLTRALFIRLACDGDLNHDGKVAHGRIASRLTVAQALEMAGSK